MNKLWFVFCYYSAFYYGGLRPELRRVRENYIFSLNPSLCPLQGLQSCHAERGLWTLAQHLSCWPKSLAASQGQRGENPPQKEEGLWPGEESGRGTEGPGLRDGPGLIPEGGRAVRSKPR